ncbi:hypothetical protein AAVH_32542, partial [Aphelenchoides avenae]
YDDEHPPTVDESIYLTEAREEQWGIDSMDRIPTVGDFGMPALIGRPSSARRVLPIRRPSPDHRQSQLATRPSPKRDAQHDRTAASSDPSDAAALRGPPRPDPYFLSDSEEGSMEQSHDEERHPGAGAFNAHDYFDEDFGAPVPVQQQQTGAVSPSDAQESRDLLLDWNEAPVARTPVQTEHVIVEEASTVPDQETAQLPAKESHQLTAKKATEEKLKALYSEGRQKTFGREMDEPDFDCDFTSQPRRRQTSNFDADAFWGTNSQARAASAAAPPQTVDQETSDFEMPPLRATPLAASFNATTDAAPPPPRLAGGGAIPLPPPPTRSDQPAPVDLSKPIPMPPPQEHDVKNGAPMAEERKANPSTIDLESSRIAHSQSAIHSSESSTASVFEDEGSSSGFRTPQEEPTPPSEGDSFARSSDGRPDAFDTAEEGSEEEEETRTARPSGSSLATEMAATPKASRSPSAIDPSTGGFELSLEQFGLHELLPELVASVHPGSQPFPPTAAAFGASTPATGALPAAIARGFEDFFDSQERSMTARTAAHLNGAVDLECFAPDFLEELPTDALQTQGLVVQSSPGPSASPAAKPECEPYVMRDEWHIGNYEAAGEERRRFCAE